MQQHVRLPPYDAGRRTRRVEQHGVERLAVPPGCVSLASATRNSACAPSGVNVSRTRFRRRWSMSSASRRREGSRSSRWAALPPGAAHASSTYAPWPAARRRRPAGRTRPAPRLALSEARQRRHRNGRIDAQRIGQSGRAETIPTSCRREAYSSRVPLLRFTRNHSGAACALAWKIASASVAPLQIDLLAQPCRPRRGGIGSGKPSRCARRSNALTMPT